MTVRSPRTRPSGSALLWSLAAVALFLIWGGLWWWVKYGSVADDVDKPRKLRVRASERAEGVYVHTKGVIRIVAGDVEIHVIPRPDSTPEISAFAPRAQEWLTREQEELRKVGRKMIAGGKFAQTIGVTDEQAARARRLKLDTELILTDADRQDLLGPYRAWKESHGDAHQEAERLLLATAREVGLRSIAATKQSLLADVEQIRTILTPEQWRKHDELLAARYR